MTGLKSKRQTVTATYDHAGRLTAANDNGRSLSYLYDAAGNRLRVTWPDAFYVTYSYDPLNKMTAVMENGTTTLASYTRDDLARRTLATFGNGTNTSYAYEIDNDLSTLAQNFVGSSVSFGFTSNNVHQVTAKTITDSTFEWHAAVNDSTSYTPNNLNQYTAVQKNLTNQAYAYDGNGNMTTDGQNTYGYDAENRLLTANTTVPAVHTVTYQYDPLGRRYAKVVDSVVTAYLSDQVEEIGEYDGSGTLLRRYVYGPAVDEPIVMYTGSGTSTKSYYHTDAQGSVIALTNSSGAVTDKYVYNPFGDSADTPSGNPIRYTGRRFDAETGLYYYRARYYSPTLGRFLQTDPIGYKDQMNMYAYVGNDPLKYRDPSGMWTCFGNVGDCNDVGSFFEDLEDGEANSSLTSKQRSIYGKVMKYLGKRGEKNGVVIFPTRLDGQEGQAGPKSGAAPKGRIDIDLSKITNEASHIWPANLTHSMHGVYEALGAGTLAHEAQHEIDGPAPGSKAAEENTETNAYTTEAIVNKALDLNSGLWNPATGALEQGKILEQKNKSTDWWCAHGGNC